MTDARGCLTRPARQSARGRARRPAFLAAIAAVTVTVAAAVTLAGVSLGLVSGCSEKVSTLRLIAGVDGTAPRGLVCRQASDPTKLLVERGLDAGLASVVIDFVRLGGTPGCRVSELVSWCAERGCTVLGNNRVCVDIDLADARTSTDVILTFAEALESFQVTGDAPQESVLIRALALAQPCSQIPGPGASNLEVSCGALMGCLYTCPITLGEARGDIVLDFDVLDDNCEAAVELCSSSEVFPTSGCLDATSLPPG